MNYERVKKVIVSLALMCVITFSTLVANVVPANAQGYQSRYFYSYPYGSYQYGYSPYGSYPYGSYQYGYSPYGYSPYGSYPYGYSPYEYNEHHEHFGGIGKLHWWWF
jgi:hypothetical protein